MIRSFGDEATADLYDGRETARVRRYPAAIVSSALTKLDMIQAAHQLSDLAAPPGNRLEALKGELRGWHGIRVNDLYRIVFRWQDGGADDVTITDYH